MLKYEYSPDSYKLSSSTDYLIKINNENFSVEKLFNRGKYLSECIDHKCHISLYDLLKQSDKKFNSIDYLPGSGKTTAYRKYIVNTFQTFTDTNAGILSLPRNEDVNILYYDIISQIIYNKIDKRTKKLDDYIIKNLNSFCFKFIDKVSDIDEYIKTLPQFFNYQWIITNHQHLLIDPPFILYKYQSFEDILSFKSRTRRYSLLIDEMPRNCYEVFDIKKYYNILLTGKSACNLIEYKNNNYKYPEKLIKSENPNGDFVNPFNKSNNTEIMKDREKFHYELLKTLLDISYNREKYIGEKVPLLLGSDTFNLEQVSPEINNSSIKRILNAKVENKLDKVSHTIRASRFAYKYSFIVNEFSKLKFSDIDKFYIDLRRIYFSLNKLEFDKILIFNGTSDLTFKNSKYINIFTEDNKFEESNKLLDIIKIKISDENSSDYVNRNLSLESFKYLIETIVNKITNDNPDSKILLYTWMSVSKDKNNKRVNIFEIDDEDDDKILKSIFEFKNPDRIRFTYFNSGEEKVTSKFTDCDILINIGSFYYPNFHLSNHNLVYESECSKNDLNLDLKVQALFRTQLRIGKPVKYYTTNLDDLDKYLKYNKPIQELDLSNEIPELKYYENDAKLLMFKSFIRRYFILKEINFDNLNLDNITKQEVNTAVKTFTTDSDLSLTKDQILMIFDNKLHIDGVEVKTENILEVKTCIDLTSSELNNFFNYKKMDNEKIKRFLDKYGIEYEFLGSGIGGNNNKRIYRFTNLLKDFGLTESKTNKIIDLKLKLNEIKQKKLNNEINKDELDFSFIDHYAEEIDCENDFNNKII